jgi:hypothetical protein
MVAQNQNDTLFCSHCSGALQKGWCENCQIKSRPTTGWYWWAVIAVLILGGILVAIFVNVFGGVVWLAFVVTLVAVDRYNIKYLEPKN